MKGTEAIPARDPGSSLHEGWHRGAFMEIYVRAWRDANGDGTGDLRGLIAGLPYLQELGVRGLWLMPVFPSADHQHGYAVTDFRAINPEYGTLADFDELLAQAHARGIGIVIDYLVNHSASTHPLFEASRSARQDNPYRDWYVWRDEPPEGWRIYGHDPWWRDASGYYFGAFSAQMPDFNWRHPALVEWHHDNLRFWLNRGVDGFRFDACGHLVENGPQAWNLQPENYRIVAELRRLLDGYQRRFMVCEAPADPAGFARAGGSAFAFDINKSLVDAAGGDPVALAKVARHFEQAPASISTMLSNHDAFAGPRVHDQLAGDPGALRRAATLLLTLPGTPFIYYGEEVGMAGDPRLRPDPSVRTAMRWDLAAAQRDDGHSLLNFYRRLLALRNSRVSLREGSYRVDRLEDGVLAFRRRWQDEQTLVVVGNSAAGQPLAAPLLVDREARLAVYAV